MRNRFTLDFQKVWFRPHEFLLSRRQQKERAINKQLLPFRPCLQRIICRRHQQSQHLRYCDGRRAVPTCCPILSQYVDQKFWHGLRPPLYRKKNVNCNASLLFRFKQRSKSYQLLTVPIFYKQNVPTTEGLFGQDNIKEGRLGGGGGSLHHFSSEKITLILWVL